MTNNNYGRGRGRSNWRGNPRGFQPGRAPGGREAYAYNETAGRVAAYPGLAAYGGTHRNNYQQHNQGYGGQGDAHHIEFSEGEMHHMDVGPTQAYDETMEMEMFQYDESGGEYYDDGSGDAY